MPTAGIRRGMTAVGVVVAKRHYSPGAGASNNDRRLFSLSSVQVGRHGPAHPI